MDDVPKQEIFQFVFVVFIDWYALLSNTLQDFQSMCFIKFNFLPILILIFKLLFFLIYVIQFNSF